MIRKEKSHINRVTECRKQGSVGKRQRFHFEMYVSHPCTCFDIPAPLLPREGRLTCPGRKGNVSVSLLLLLLGLGQVPKLHTEKPALSRACTRFPGLLLYGVTPKAYHRVATFRRLQLLTTRSAPQLNSRHATNAAWELPAGEIFICTPLLLV